MTFSFRFVVVAALLLCHFAVSNPDRIATHIKLRVKHQKQDWNMCLPTSGSIVLDFFGDKRTPEALLKLANYTSIKNGMAYVHLLQALKKIDYHWDQQCYPLGDDGFLKGLKAVKRNLTQKLPVILTVNYPPIGHAVVISGYDERRKTVSVVDPSFGSGTRMLSYRQFKDLWKERTIKLRCVVFTSKKAK